MSMTACQSDTRAADLAAVQSTDQALSEAVSSKDLNRTLSFYAGDASILPVAEPAVRGTDAIRQEWEHIFALPGFKSTAKTTNVEVAGSGDIAYTQGTYTAEFELADGNRAEERGKWVTIWKKQADGAWKVAIEIYNTDGPPPEHQ